MKQPAIFIIKKLEEYYKNNSCAASSCNSIYCRNVFSV